MTNETLKETRSN